MTADLGRHDAATILATLRKASENGKRPEIEIAAEVRALLVAVGLHGEDDADKYFNELASTRVNHRAIANAFLEISRSEDSDLLGCIERHAKVYPVIITSLRASTRSIDLPTRANSSPMKIKADAERLYIYHSLRARRGAPIKTVIVTLMIGLANIYRDAVDPNIDIFELPHAERSSFIQFAWACLRPYFPLTEASAGALATRWKRVKAHERTGHPNP